MTDKLAHADSLPEYPTDPSVRMSLYPVRELMHPKVSMNHQARPPGDSSDRWSESTPRYSQDRSREYRAGLPIAARLPRRNEYRPAFSPSKLRNKNWTATRLIHDN